MEEQIIGILREQATGAPAGDVRRKEGISSPTFYTWKAKYGVCEAKQPLCLIEDAIDDVPSALSAALCD